MPDHPEHPEPVESRLQRLEESQLYAQHDHEATLAALEDLSQRFETLMLRLTRLEGRLQESSRSHSNEDPQDASDNGPGCA